MISPKQTNLRDRLKAIGRVAVAFSAGTDSAFLLREASLSGAEALALTANTAFLTRAEYERAKEVANLIGVAHEYIDIDVWQHSRLLENPADRCYHCKGVIMNALISRARSCGYTLCDGANVDDASHDRPGARAVRELGILSPLQEAGFTKDEIRALSDGLPTQNLPSNACLATRIPAGVTITPEALRMIEQSEAALVALGFIEVRVRAHGELARIEWPGEPIEIANRAEEAANALVEAGYKFVCLDLRGYRIGGANA